jgi:polysaccharide export outer membrane protein
MTVQSIALLVCSLMTAQGVVQGSPQGAAVQAAPSASARVASDPVVPTDYIIGPDDVLTIVFWKDKDMSAEVVVRPDGKITLPLGKEIVAAGLTPDQLKDAVLQEARRFVKDEPQANVIVKQINSRRVFITGQVTKPGAYQITSSTTVMQLISLAGGLMEFAKAKEIVILRTDGRGPIAYPFNYEDVAKGRRLSQNIVLRPGDNVVVP